MVQKKANKPPMSLYSLLVNIIAVDWRDGPWRCKSLPELTVCDTGLLGLQKNWKTNTNLLDKV